MSGRGPAQRRTSRAPAAADRVSASGWLAFSIGLLQLGSGFQEARLSIAGLALLPYLLLMLPVTPVVLARRGLFGLRVLAKTMAVFFGAFLLSYAAGEGDLGAVSKLGVFLVTMLTVALLVRSGGDFRAGSMGLILGVALLATRGLSGIEDGAIIGVGVNPFEGVASKNLYSMYALPAVFLASALAVKGQIKWWQRVAVAVLGAAVALALFGSANRSGWAGLVVLPVLFAGSRRNLRVAIFMTLLVGAAYIGLQRFGLMPVMEQRIELTRSGNAGDEVRQELYLATVPIFLSNPVFGTFLPELDYELSARILGSPDLPLGPHSVVILLVAGGGLFVLVPFLYFARSLWRLELAPRSAGGGQFSAQWLLRRLMFLWLVRGIFSDEVLYAPAFAIAAGLLVGLNLVEARRVGVVRPGPDAQRRGRAARTAGVRLPRPSVAMRGEVPEWSGDAKWKAI